MWFHLSFFSFRIAFMEHFIWLLFFVLVLVISISISSFELLFFFLAQFWFGMFLCWLNHRLSTRLFLCFFIDFFSGNIFFRFVSCRWLLFLRPPSLPPIQRAPPSSFSFLLFLFFSFLLSFREDLRRILLGLFFQPISALWGRKSLWNSKETSVLVDFVIVEPVRWLNLIETRKMLKKWTEMIETWYIINIMLHFIYIMIEYDYVSRKLHKTQQNEKLFSRMIEPRWSQQNVEKRTEIIEKWYIRNFMLHFIHSIIEYDSISLKLHETQKMKNDSIERHEKLARICVVLLGAFLLLYSSVFFVCFFCFFFWSRRFGKATHSASASGGRGVGAGGGVFHLSPLKDRGGAFLLSSFFLFIFFFVFFCLFYTRHQRDGWPSLPRAPHLTRWWPSLRARPNGYRVFTGFGLVWTGLA